MLPGEEIHLSGGARVILEDKTGRRATLRVIADAGTEIFYVQAAVTVVSEAEKNHLSKTDSIG